MTELPYAEYGVRQAYVIELLGVELFRRPMMIVTTPFEKDDSQKFDISKVHDYFAEMLKKELPEGTDVTPRRIGPDLTNIVMKRIGEEEKVGFSFHGKNIGDVSLFNVAADLQVLGEKPYGFRKKKAYHIFDKFEAELKTVASVGSIQSVVPGWEIKPN